MTTGEPELDFMALGIVVSPRITSEHLSISGFTELIHRVLAFYGYGNQPGAPPGAPPIQLVRGNVFSFLVDGDEETPDDIPRSHGYELARDYFLVRDYPTVDHKRHAQSLVRDCTEVVWIGLADDDPLMIRVKRLAVATGKLALAVTLDPTTMDCAAHHEFFQTRMARGARGRRAAPRPRERSSDDPSDEDDSAAPSPPLKRGRRTH